MLLASVGSTADPANGGRQMPSHWGNQALHIVAGSSATTTQLLHAVGAAEAGLIYSRVAAIPDGESFFHGDEVVFASLGEGSTSEGEFWEAITAACTRRLPVLFLVEDNGYAISVPVEVETPGGDISRLVGSFPGLHVSSVDGTDFLASLETMRRRGCVRQGARKGPALVHAHVVRPYSHSHSDDERSASRQRSARRKPKRDPIRVSRNS